MSIVIKTAAEISKMREAGKIQSQILNEIGERVKPGVSTLELDLFARQRCKDFGVEAGFLGYQGFPAAICASINDQVVHCIPSAEVILQERDILKVDFGVKKDGWNSDACQTFAVGKIDTHARELLDTTKAAMYAGVEQAIAGNRVGDISHAIESTVAPHGYSPVRETVGHGIGRRLHEDPEVPNWGRAGRGPELVPGMVICIEPIINIGTHRIMTEADGWTTRTADGELSAHFEHQVAITADGAPEILTPWDR